MARELIVVIGMHRKFGAMLFPHIITPTNATADSDSIYSAIDDASCVNIKDVEGYCPEFDLLLKISDEISDYEISRKFSKEPMPTFLRHVDAEFVEQRVRPYIELRLKKILQIIESQHIRIFHQSYRDAKLLKSDQVNIQENYSQAIYVFSRIDEGIHYHIDILNNDERVSFRGKRSLVLTAQEPCNILVNNTLYRFKNLDSKKFLPFFSKNFILINKENELKYCEQYILRCIKTARVHLIGMPLKSIDEPPVATLHLETDLNLNLALVLRFNYGQKQIYATNTERCFADMKVDGDQISFTRTKRNFQVEKELIEKLTSLGFSTVDQTTFYPAGCDRHCDNSHQILALLNKVYTQLNELGVKVLQDKLEQQYYIGNIDLTLSSKANNDWFDLYGDVTLNGYSFPFIKLRNHILKGIREYQLPDGQIVILPNEWFSQYYELMHMAQPKQNWTLGIGKQHFGLIIAANINSPDAIKLQQQLCNPQPQKDTLPIALQATLRPYQLAGFYWMKQLRDLNLGGCLADDMGLGKTLQTLTLLADSAQNIEAECGEIKTPLQLDLFTEPDYIKPRPRPTSLLVVPLSLIHNWKSEILKFAPHLKVLIHSGISRAKNVSAFTLYDIVITTYGLVRNDTELLEKFRFHYIILDESQAIKNPSSKNYQSIIRLQSEHKLVLTGTPIENNLIDLWTQMNFVNPGLLGNLQYFKSTYVAPIERDLTGQHSKRLQRLIEPFILRRTKSQVASDLPPKTEQICICDMDDEQAKLYEKEKSQIRNTLLSQYDKQDAIATSALVLQSLTKLRLLACHPQLAGSELPSGKFNEVIRVLETILSENHKVLIFSSFVSQLEIYEQYFQQQKIGYSKLTGQTADRKSTIEQFQNDSKRQVFLISLKAGGVGINLTSADYVFILDPWWNPAAENQAIDRAHRIGQTRNVFVYRFITQNTIEEKIIKLQDRKTELSNMFINTNNPLKGLSMDTIMELFS